MGDVGVDTRLYDAIFKVYRNAVVAFIRTRLKAVYGDTWEDNLRAPLQVEWATLGANARKLRDSGSVTQGLRDDADLLGVNHFHSLFEKYFSDLWPAHSANRELRANLLGWARTVKTYRDPVGHPYELEMDLNDAGALLDAARRILLQIDIESAQRISAINASLRSSPRANQYSDPLQTFLPARETIVMDFVGREQILHTLHSWFADPLSKRWVLAGDGGKGKSAIAYTFAEQVAQLRPVGFAGVVWLSAKQRQFVEGEVIPARPDFTDLRSALDRLLYIYGSEASQSPAKGIAECLEALQPPLAMLVVVDDIDSLSREEEDAAEFLTVTLPTSGSKVLFTSRRELFGLGNTTTIVPGLAEEEARDFVESRIRRYQLGRERFSDEAISLIIHATDASPLYMEDLIRLCGSLSPSDAIRGWTTNRGSKVREYAVAREVELLSQNGQRCLIACALSAGPVTLPELQVIANLSEDDVVAAVDELRTLYLIPQPSLIDDQPRYTLNSNTQSLVSRVYGKEKVGYEIQAALKHLGQHRSELEPEVGALCRQATVYAHGALFKQAEVLLLAALEGPYPEHPRILAQLGWLYHEWRPKQRIVDARLNFRRAFEMGNQVPNTYVTWTKMELSQNAVSAAVEASQHGLDICGRRDPRLLWVAAMAMSSQASELRGRFEEDSAAASTGRAHELYLAALTAARTVPVDSDQLSRIYRGIVRTARDLGKTPAVKEYLKEWGEQLPGDGYYRALGTVRGAG